MADDVRNILIMGIGNLLMGDEGIGVHAVRALSRAALPGDVDLLDVGTAFIDALPHIENRTGIIIIDAVKGGKPPGTVYRIDVNPHGFARESTSLHGMSVINMLAFSGCRLPETITILGVEPDVIDWSMDLSSSVERALPLLVEAVLNETGRCSEVVNACPA